MATDKKKKPEVPAWQLKQWAGEAAQLHVSDGIPLSDAVIRVLQKKNVGIAHIKRVCEETNNQAFNILFNRGDKNRSVVFAGGPADPAIVVRELKDGFAAAPAQEAAMKTASVNNVVPNTEQPDTMTKMLEKVASTDVSNPASAQEAKKLRSLLKKATMIWTRSARDAQHKYASALSRLETEVRSAIGSGESADQVASAIKVAMPNDFLAEVVLSDLRKKAAVFRDAKPVELEKIANVEHPLYKVAAYTYKAAADLVKFSKAAQLSMRQYQQLNAKWPEV